ncbi:MAG TPA: TolC family protein, partial [Myxococcaceae bacterium]
AVSIARGENHSIASSALELNRVDEQIAALRTQRYPGFKFEATGTRTLKSMDFAFPAGAWGSYAATGPIPSTTTSINVPTGFFGNVVASVSQPITQQYRLALKLDSLRLDYEISAEELRKERQRIVAEVKSVYYDLSATAAGIAALRDLVKAIEDVDALTSRYLTEGRVLRSESLEVKARLARERQRLSASENDLDTQHERLNQLLGRELGTPYRVATPSELVASRNELPLEDARQRAIANRPEIKKSSLTIERAETSRKIADSQWIPDVSVGASYTRNINYQVIPKEVATAFVTLSWEPWDWGRRFHEAHEQGVAAAQARESRKENQEQVGVQVGKAWRAVRDAAARLEAARVSEEAASAYLFDTKNKYREDAKLLNDVLEAEARLSSARHNFTDALSGYWSATAELERTIGDANS